MKIQPRISWLWGRVSRNVIFWLVFTLWHFMSRGNIREWYLPMLVFILLFYGIPSYVNNLWLIPRFLMRRKYWLYALLYSALLVLTAAISREVTTVFNAMYPGMNFMGPVKASLLTHIIVVIWVFLPVALGKFMADSIQNQLKLEDLQRQRLESELSALRSQINPHFLFNALNTIYGMSRRADPGTPEAVLKLSDILRHNLYECNEPEITMEKELTMLKQYIELSKLRLHNKNAIELTINADLYEQKIAPLLLMPFVENAIKHGLGGNASNAWMNVRISLSGKHLSFTCANTNKKKTIVNGNSGIGLANVRRRLELIYPNRHALKIADTEKTYSVTLDIHLN